MNSSQSAKAHSLADRAIANPSLLKVLDDDQMIKFAIGVHKYAPEKAHKLMDLKYPIVKPANMVLFWEAVGILAPQEDFS